MSIEKGDGADDTPTILSCPVDECGRTVVGDRTGLINHVLNTKDEGHEGKALNDDLDLVDKHGDWSPGVPDELPEDPSFAAPQEPTIRPASMTDW